MPTEPIAASGALDQRVDLVARVETSRLETQPFDHVYMEGVFPPAYYRRLLDRLPDTARYRELTHRDAMQPDGQSARRKFYLFPEHVGLLPAEQRTFWRELSHTLRSRALQDAFTHKFRGALERRFGRPVERLSLYPVPMLVRDLGGYRLRIHGDSLGKAITVQFYLPRDEAQAHLGTIFHEGRDGEADQASGVPTGHGLRLPGRLPRELAQRRADIGGRRGAELAAPDLLRPGRCLRLGLSPAQTPVGICRLCHAPVTIRGRSSARLHAPPRGSP